MGFVLADQQGWLSSSNPQPFEVVPLQTFDKLRAGVRDGTADFFMVQHLTLIWRSMLTWTQWEHFTSKKYYDNREIKRIGEIYTPWPSWQIVASTSTAPADDPRLDELFTALDMGIKHFNQNVEESVKYIYTELDYSEEDARSWLKTVKFAEGVKGVDVAVVEKTVGILKKAGVLTDQGMKPQEMAGITRES